MSAFHLIVEEEGPRLDVFLSQKTGQSRVFVKLQIEQGRVTVNGKQATKAGRRLKAGDIVAGEFEEPPAFETLSPMPGHLTVLHEDSDLLVLDKAQGVVIHPASGHRGETLVHHLLHYFQNRPDFATLSENRPGIVHRLDRFTSGVLLVAKNRSAQESLSKQFKARQIKKEYEAIAWGRMKPKGTFQSTIGRDPKDRKRMSSRSREGREALTLYESRETFAHFTHVALFPHTGRTHQLRVHLSEAGHPIVGDELYGAKSRARRVPLVGPVQALAEAAPGTFLHARALSLVHPITGEALSFEAKHPENFEAFLKCLREHDR